MSFHAITNDELTHMLVDNPELQLVDVRTPFEYEHLGVIEQAKLIPIDELPYAYKTLDPTQAVVVTCQKGVRSLDACYFLQALGFEQLYNVPEGMAGWTGPVIKPPLKQTQET